LRVARDPTESRDADEYGEDSLDDEDPSPEGGGADEEEGKRGKEEGTSIWEALSTQGLGAPVGESSTMDVTDSPCEYCKEKAQGQHF
jgi:hypothetical protein